MFVASCPDLLFGEAPPPAIVVEDEDEKGEGDADASFGSRGEPLFGTTRTHPTPTTPLINSTCVYYM